LLESRSFPADESDEFIEEKQRLVDELRALEQEISGKQAKHDKLKAEIELLQMARDDGD
jgi:cell division septum initiation protein DivIVA